jgi:hypothetical protein
VRKGYREDGEVKCRTLANLSHWTLAKIERLRRVLRDEVLPDAREGLTMVRSLPHGHVPAVRQTAHERSASILLAAGGTPARLVVLVLAMVVARVIDPASNLPTAPQLDAASATSSSSSPHGCSDIGFVGVRRREADGAGRRRSFSVCRSRSSAAHIANPSAII